VPEVTDDKNMMADALGFQENEQSTRAIGEHAHMLMWIYVIVLFKTDFIIYVT
jgi:hypothetical protein